MKKVLFQIKQLQNLIVRSICTDNPKSTISPPSLIQLEIIEYLICNSHQDVYQKDLETVFKLRRSTISGVLSTLEKNHLIQRVDSKMDARVKKIILTEKAVCMYHEAEKYLEQLEQTLTSNIKEEDLKIFFKVIKTMQQNIENK